MFWVNLYFEFIFLSLAVMLGLCLLAALFRRKP